MKKITKLTVACCLLATGALATPHTGPGLPVESAAAAAADATIAHPSVVHSPAAQGLGLTAIGPVEVDVREAVRLESILAKRRQLTGKTDEPRPGFVTGAAAARKTADANALEVPAPRWPQAVEPPPTKATGDVLRSFDGLAGTGTTPPDVMLAVGPNSVLQTNGSRFRRFQKSGQPSVSVPFETLFFSLLPRGWQGSLVGPQVVYSREHGRYLLVISGVDEIARRSYFFLAVSSSSDPRATWRTYRIDNPFPNEDGWFGDASLGVDTWGVYLTANRYSWTENVFDWAALWSFDTEVFDGGVADNWVFWDLQWPDGSRAFGLRPAMPHTVSSEELTFFVNTSPNAGDQIALWRLSGDRVDFPTLSQAAITTMPYRSIGQQVDQPGTSADLDGGDARVANAVYAYRRVYATWTSDLGIAGDSSAIQWLKLSTDSNSVVTEEILHGGSGWYYFFPAITINGGDGPLLNTGLVFNVVERNSIYLSAAAYVYTVDGDETFRLIAQGDGPYFQRTGRTNAVVYDWAQPGWMWGAASYATGSNSWNTQIAAVAMDDEASTDDDGGGGDVCIPSATTACVVDGRFQVDIVWQDSNDVTGEAELVPFSSDNSVLFWFFSANNWEMMVKVLDGCGINNRYWVFAAATTDVAYTLRVTDSENGSVSEYSNPLGNAAAAITDTDAFATCP